MVAIKHIWTMQLFYLRGGDMINHNHFPQTGPTNDVQKLLVSYRLQITPMGICGVRTNGPKRRHRCGTTLEPSEGQVSE